MTKSLLLVLALSASTITFAHDNAKGQSCPNEKSTNAGKSCENDKQKLPKELEALDLSSEQKAKIIKIREETQAMFKKQKEQIRAVLTPEQRSKVDYAKKLNAPSCDGENKAKGC